MCIRDRITNRLVASVAFKTDRVGEAELVRWCAEIIPRYMIPETFEFHDALPKTSTGKIDRQLLAKEYAARLAPLAPTHKETT